jgi:dTDP-4-amino-4,6-dideoxygalactose transaminase
VIAVHLYGEPADLTPLLEIAHDSEAFLIEDCAQAHGAAFDGRRVGTFGDAAAFSFYPTKNLGAFGDGGLVATRDPWLTSRLRMLREYGWERRQLVSIPGGVNSRLDEIQAAILRVKLTSLENDNARRRELAVRYDAGLAEVRGIMLPPGERTGHAFHQYVIGVAGRDELKAFLDSVGIGTAIHYTVPSHLQPGFRDLVATPVPLAHTERACGHILSLPMYPELEIDSVDAVTSAIRDWMTRR